jgi:hypothetical protein
LIEAFSSNTSFADAVAKVYRMYKSWAASRFDTPDDLPSGFARLEDASDERTALFSRIKHSYHPSGQNGKFRCIRPKLLWFLARRENRSAALAA